MTFVKLFGLPRSGTNYAKALVEINFQSVTVLQDVLGNKHDPFDLSKAIEWQPTERDKGYITMSPQEIEVVKNALRSGNMGAILSIKNPYSWLVSYYKLRCEKDRGFMKWSPAYIESSLPLWIRRNAGWLRTLSSAFGGRLIINSYEDTALNGTPLLIAAEQSLGLKRQNSEFITSLPNATLRANDTHRGLSVLGEKPFEQDYYALRRYRERFTERQRGIAEEMLRSVPENMKPYVVW